MATIEPTEPVVPAPETGDPGTGAVAPEGAPQIGEPEAASAPPATEEAVDWGKRVEEWGGEESVSEALEIAQALSTEEGLKALVSEAAKVLRLPEDAVEALLRGDAPAAPGGEEDDDLDRVLTARELEERLAQDRESRAAEIRQQQETVARSRVEATLSDLGVKEGEQRVAVLTFAQSFVSDDEVDPDRLAEAVRKGHEHYKSVIVAEAQKYLAEKEQQREGLPTPVASGGSAPEVNLEDKPKSLEEAKARVRERMRREGLLEPR